MSLMGVLKRDADTMLFGACGAMLGRTQFLLCFFIGYTAKARAGRFDIDLKEGVEVTGHIC